SVLSTLTQHYQSPVEIEFAATLYGTLTGRGAQSAPHRASLASHARQPQPLIHLLQCRPQSSLHGEAIRPMPTDLAIGDKLFETTRMAPQGQVNQVEYIVYVDPSAYAQMADPIQRKEVARIVGRLNKALEGKHFILIGPGRWGSNNLNLGVPVTYAD